MTRCRLIQTVVILGILTAGCGRGDSGKGKPATGQGDLGKGKPATGVDGGNVEAPAPKDKNGAEAKSKAAAVKLVSLDLSAAGLPLTIEAPEGATAEKTITDGVVVKKMDTPFELLIVDEKKYLTLAAEKAEFDKAMVTYLINEPNFLLIERTGINPTYFLRASFKSGDKTYHVSNSVQQQIFDREQIELMARSAKTLAPKK